MEVLHLPVECLTEPAWNPNQMTGLMQERLKSSIVRYGLVENLVVRPLGGGRYEVLSGNQRLKLLRRLGVDPVPCVVAEVNDADARLLAQALNHVRGEDDLGLRAAVLREVLEAVPEDEVLAVLPEGAENLRSLASLANESIAEYLQAWQQSQAARLKHLQFQLTRAQLEVVEEALAQVLPAAKQAQGDSPNARGTALYLLCRAYLKGEEEP